MKMSDLIYAQEAFKKLCAQNLSLKTLYRLFGFLDKIEAQMKFYDVQRMRILGEYCRLENGRYEPIAETEAEFNQRFNELMNLDVDLGDTELPIEISENEDIKLSYSDLITLRKFIKLTGGENKC